MFTYLGPNISKIDDFITLDQNKYIEDINFISVPSKATDSLLTKEERGVLRRKIGQLLWVHSVIVTANVSCKFLLCDKSEFPLPVIWRTQGQ